MSKTPSIEVGFARRQTPTSRFGYYKGTASALVELICAHFERALPVNEEKTILRVPLPAEGFWTSVRRVRLKEPLMTVFEPRREGEEPVMNTVVFGTSVPALSVEVILYHRDVLGDEAETKADWEVVSINPSPLEGPYPMDPVTMARNQLVKEGGTFQRTYSPEEWAASVWFWTQHANALP